MDFTISSDILCELLEVSINLILYTREVYPPVAFQRRKKYNIPVQMVTYPELSSYISDCVGSIKDLLEKGEVRKLFVVILSKDKKVVEKFIFDIKQEPVRPFDVKRDPEFSKLEEALRAFCLKLSISDSLLTPLPPHCSFTIQVEVPRHCHKDVETAFPWVEAEAQHVQVESPRIVPLKTLRSEICDLQLYVEETGRRHQ